jgi:glycosyltransferase involved in cell wall biosynthesis
MNTVDRSPLGQGSQPVVSIIIIFLNAERFMHEAIASVFAQTYDNWEMILVDDGSTDASTRIALDCAGRHPEKVRYLEHPGHENQGMSASRNLGIRHAKGDYVAFLDADDIWLPHKLERQTAIMRQHPDVGMVYGATRYWRSWTANPEDFHRDHTPKLGIQTDTVVNPPALLTLLYPLGCATAPCPSDIMLRREVAERVGGFEEAFTGLYEDQAFLAKVYLDAAVYVSNECWDLYRQHPTSCMSIAQTSGQYDSVRVFFLNWLERHLSTHGITDTKIWYALRQSQMKYRNPKLHRVLTAMQGSISQVRGLFSALAREHKL